MMIANVLFFLFGPYVYAFVSSPRLLLLHLVSYIVFIYLVLVSLISDTG